MGSGNEGVTRLCGWENAGKNSAGRRNGEEGEGEGFEGVEMDQRRRLNVHGMQEGCPKMLLASIDDDLLCSVTRRGKNGEMNGFRSRKETTADLKQLGHLEALVDLEAPEPRPLLLVFAGD